MMKKKLLSAVTAICCLTASMGGMPVFAELSASPWVEGDYLVLSVSTKAGTTELSQILMQRVGGSLCTIGCGADLDAYLEGQETPEAGDILRINFSGITAEIYPECMHLEPEDTVVNLGSATELGECMTLTLTEIHNSTYTLQDAAGTVYTYSDAPSFVSADPTLISTAAPGDKVECVIYEDILLAPLSITRLGDVNADGKVSIVDVIMLNHHIMGAGAVTYSASSTDRTAADFNGDGSLTADDSLSILKRLVGLA